MITVQCIRTELIIINMIFSSKKMTNILQKKLATHKFLFIGKKVTSGQDDQRKFYLMGVFIALFYDKKWTLEKRVVYI